MMKQAYKSIRKTVTHFKQLFWTVQHLLFFLSLSLPYPPPENSWAARERERILKIQMKSQESVMAEATSTSFLFPVRSKVQ